LEDGSELETADVVDGVFDIHNGVATGGALRSNGVAESA
jgi:hypothetical protein